MKSGSLSRIVLGSLVIGFVSSANAGGFEKNVMWSGRYSSQGGAAAASVVGSESVYFNPAGLVQGGKAQELTANFSPTASQYRAPTTGPNTEMEAERGFSPIFGVTYKYALNDKMSVGAGYYVAGGTSVLYKDVVTTNDVESSITATELALAFAYKVSDQLRLGLAWRATMVEANFSAILPGPTIMTNEDLRATSFSGFRLGAQYDVNSDLQLGLNYRSSVEFSAKGDGALNLSGSDVTVKSSLPQQLALGAAYTLNEEWSLFSEYVWTNYAAISKFTFDFATLSDVNLPAKWEDQHNFRFAGEYRGFGLPIRAGYVFTTAAVPPKYAQATFSTPGLSHTLTAGSGIGLMDDNLMLNGGLEYSFSNADVSSNASNLNGDYSSWALAAHLGLTYAF